MKRLLCVLGLVAVLGGCGKSELDELTELAEQGDALAQNNLGVAYANGDGVAENDAEAVKWYRKAADQGEAMAQLNLGDAYANGDALLRMMRRPLNGCARQRIRD